MTGERTRERDRREVRADGVAWLAMEGWRGRAGHGLCYLVRLEGREPAADDRGDRRAALEPGERLSELDEERTATLVAASVPLTETERRFSDASGHMWLAQNSGPVWAGGDVASGLTGIVFTRLDGDFLRVEAPGGHVAGLGVPDLQAHLHRALRARREGAER